MEPKPTLVALSPGSGKRSSTGESDGFSDYENSTSYDETDGDTDGERLVTDKPDAASGSTDDVCAAKFDFNLVLLSCETQGMSSDDAVLKALASHQCSPGSIPGLAVICGLSLLLVLILRLLREVFLRVLRFSPLLKNQHLQIPS